MSFDYKKAFVQIIEPCMAALSSTVLELYAYVVTHGRDWRQNKELDVPIPEADHPAFCQQLRATPSRDLAHAAATIYYYGHWSHEGPATLRYGDLPPQQFPCARAAKDHAEMLDEYPPKVDWLVETSRRGPSATHGAEWKFSNMVDQVLRQRVLGQTARSSGSGWAIHEGKLRYCRSSPTSWEWDEICFATEDELARADDWKKAHGYDRSGEYWDDFKEAMLAGVMPPWNKLLSHDEGYWRLDTHDKPSLSDIPKLFGQLVRPTFRMVGVAHVNHKPHPFVITQKHLEKSPNGILDPNCAMCGYRERPHDPAECRLPYDKHTSDTALVLRPLRNFTKAEAAAACNAVIAAVRESGVAAYRFDGFAFASSRHGYKLIDTATTA